MHGRTKDYDFLNDAHDGNQHQVAKRRIHQTMPQQLHTLSHHLLADLILKLYGLPGRYLFRFLDGTKNVTSSYQPADAKKNFLAKRRG